jgi:fructose-1,6-bisphosphatase/inositol monophosphatase family enzyme
VVAGLADRRRCATIVSVPGPGDDLMQRVGDIVREASAACVEPRFGRLGAGESWDKAPGETVTVADEEAERMLAGSLPAYFPAPVVGEEGCSRDPSLLEALAGEWAWVVDPVDGTANFAAARPDWAVMVALLHGGSPVAGWIWRPTVGHMYAVQAGAGAWRDGVRLHRRPPVSADPADLRGAVLTRVLPPERLAVVEANRGRFAEVTAGRYCAGAEYPALVEGEQDFVSFWRALPWDHAPGTLLAREAGCQALHLDGTPYRPAVRRTGLLVAAGEAAWTAARDALWGGDQPQAAGAH